MSVSSSLRYRHLPKIVLLMPAEGPIGWVCFSLSIVTPLDCSTGTPRHLCFSSSGRRPRRAIALCSICRVFPGLVLVLGFLVFFVLKSDRITSVPPDSRLYVMHHPHLGVTIVPSLTMVDVEQVKLAKARLVFIKVGSP